MEKKSLGKSELKIVPLIFGGNVFGWTLNEKESHYILDSFVDRGFDAIDTANQYSFWVPGNRGGESEVIIGNWLADKGGRDRYVIMTKVGGVFADNPSPNTSYKHIVEQVDLSLKRLRTDYIDLYQTHFDDETVPVEETLKAYDELISAGKVRVVGASNLTPERLVESLQVSKEKSFPRYETLQPLYNLYSRESYEDAYEDIALENDLSVIPYYSLASGFLSGKYQEEADFSKSVRGSGVKEMYWNERGKRIVGTLNGVAKRYDTTPSAVALAWLLRKKSITAPIASATKLEHLTAFVEAVQLKLDVKTLEELEKASK